MRCGGSLAAMNESHFSGSWRMALAMILSGTIGMVVTESGQAPLTVVFFRCLIGGGAMIVWLSWHRGWRPMTRSDAVWLAVGGYRRCVSRGCCARRAFVRGAPRPR